MIKKEKSVEYYFDSKKYNKTQVMQNMQKEQMEFPKKQGNISITLNEYGIYIARLDFLNNKISVINNKYIQKIMGKIYKTHKERMKNTYKGYETYNGENKIYGKYKETKLYEPF